MVGVEGHTPPVASVIAERVLHEQVRLLYQALPLAFMATLLNGIILAWFLADLFGPTLCWGWFALLSGIGLARYVHAQYARRRAQRLGRRLGRRELHLFNLGSLSAGLCWSLVPGFMLPPSASQNLIIVVVVISGIAAGSISTLAYRRTTVLYFLAPLLTALGVQLIERSSDALGLITGALSFLFLGMLYASAVRIEAGNTQTIRLRLEAEGRQAELNRALLRLQEANRTRANLIANISHELRTPLNHIIGHGEILQRRALGGEAQHDLAVIDRSARHLRLLVDDLLALAEVSDGRTALSPESVSMPTLLHGLLEPFAAMARHKGLVLAIEAAGELPSVLRLDQRVVSQVLSSLLSNAIKFTPRGTVRLGLKHQGSWLQIDVIDTGVGIESADLEGIFEPFSKLGGRYLKSEGSGIGLSLARSLTTLAGGRLEVHSVLGQGSHFTVSLPASAEGEGRFNPTLSEPVAPLAWGLDGLSPVARERLAELVQCGRVREVLALAEQLQQEMDEPPKVLGEIARLARGLQMRELLSLFAPSTER